MGEKAELMNIVQAMSRGHMDCNNEPVCADSLILPQCSFSDGNFWGNNIKIAYISDIHLGMHMTSCHVKRDDEQAVNRYVDHVVGMLLTKSFCREYARSGVSPDNLRDCCHEGYWYIFERECRDIPERERRGLGALLYNGATNRTIKPHLINCIAINGDLSADASLVELFFAKFSSRLKSITHGKAECPLFFVLGNHECSGFDTADEASEFYSERLNQFGVSVLHNTFIEYGNCVVVGGTGFAKYNPNYNADNLIGPRKMQHNREYECAESDRFREQYFAALSVATKENKPVIVLTHYPVRDWLDGVPSPACYYFSGHSHNNIIESTDICHIYADNQVGYTAKKMQLMARTLGTCRNPFVEFEDGAYEITPKQYADFYDYTGERVGTGLIVRQIEKNGHLHMIKKEGFFGFFIINDKGAKICAGGKTKLIGTVKDIEYYSNYFMLMVQQYIEAMLPFRRLQERIAEEVKACRINDMSAGRIHGSIVDVDFFHHIMINPLDGKITFYYSPEFGVVKELPSFAHLLKSVKKGSFKLGSEVADSLVLWGKSESQHLGDIAPILCSVSAGGCEGELVKINIKDSIYPLSGKINQLQRLFTSNILRDWDEELFFRITRDRARSILGQEGELTPQQLVRKHWKYLLDVEPDQIDDKVVKEALRKNRKCPFPYLSTEKVFGREFACDRMSPEDIREYINRIPVDVLKNRLEDFAYFLGIEVLAYYPLGLLSEEDYDIVFSRQWVDNRKLVELIERIPVNDWTDSFINKVVLRISVKARPSYCTKELWCQIKDVRNKARGHGKK